MSVEIISKGEVLTAFLSGELDHHSAAEMRKEIDEAAERNMPSLLGLDFSGITFMDSSGIGLVMGRYAKISRFGGKIHIANPSPAIYKVMKIGGLSRLATIDSPQEKE